MILASDYDGTLRVSKRVEPYDLEMIRRWQQAGHRFIAVTGRSMQTFEKEMEINAFHPDFIVTNNGGALYDRDGCQVKVNEIPFEQAMRIYHYLTQLPCSSIVVNEGKYRAVQVLDEASYDAKGREAGPYSVEEIIAKGRIAQFVLFIGDETLCHQIAKEIEMRFGDVVQPFINVDCIDIVPKGCDKGKGLKQAIALLKAEGEVYAIGDSYNDLPMLDAYIGCCVAHADDAIKAHAAYVFAGVGEAIAYLLAKQEEKK